MDFEQVVKKRFMCRSYDARDVPDEVVDRILDLAVRYPSAGHTQPQEFIVIRNPATKLKLAEAALGQMYVAEAPVDVVVISDSAVLGLPEVIRPIGIVPIGYCAERPQKLPRRPRQEIIHYERWRDALGAFP